MANLPIVGSFYRPPAKLLLDKLPIQTPLTLMAEPENPHDANAIAIFLRGADVPELASLNDELASFGTTLAQVRATEFIHVGYIPRDDAAMLRAQGFPESGTVPGIFMVGANGGPRVRFSEDF